jgi:hypothetical protein
VRNTATSPSLAGPAACAALCMSLAACTPTGDPAPSPPPSASAAADPFSLRVGDCIPEDIAAGEVLQVPIVDCGEEHAAEAYSSKRLPDGDYPGLDAVKTLAVETCLDRFEAFAGIAFDDSQHLDFGWYYPTEGSWSTGDREVLCLIMRIDPATGQTVPTTGTLRDYAR